MTTHITTQAAAPAGSAYSVKLPAFEGPLDLLLHLIREHKIDIYDIPISTITEQYLKYIEIMKELNLEVAGEFLVMAATLIHIKSRMMLPIEETADTEEPEDPRLELVMRLLQYKELKEAALTLKEREDEWSDVLIREPSESDADTGDELSLFNVNLFDLLGAFKKILDRAPEEIRTITRETLNIKDKMSLIMGELERAEAVRFEDLFKRSHTKTHMVVTFIALLELLRLGLAKAYQEREFSTLWIIRAEPRDEPVAHAESPEAHAESDNGRADSEPPSVVSDAHTPEPLDDEEDLANLPPELALDEAGAGGYEPVEGATGEAAPGEESGLDVPSPPI